MANPQPEARAISSRSAAAVLGLVEAALQPQAQRQGRFLAGVTGGVEGSQPGFERRPPSLIVGPAVRGGPGRQTAQASRRAPARRAAARQRRLSPGQLLRQSVIPDQVKPIVGAQGEECGRQGQGPCAGLLFDRPQRRSKSGLESPPEGAVESGGGPLATDAPGLHRRVMDGVPCRDRIVQGHRDHAVGGREVALEVPGEVAGAGFLSGLERHPVVHPISVLCLTGRRPLPGAVCGRSGNDKVFTMLCNGRNSPPRKGSAAAGWRPPIKSGLRDGYAARSRRSNRTTDKARNATATAASIAASAKFRP